MNEPAALPQELAKGQATESKNPLSSFVDELFAANNQLRAVIAEKDEIIAAHQKRIASLFVECDALDKARRAMIEVERLRRRVMNDEYHGDSEQEKEYAASRDATFKDLFPCG